MKRFEDKVVIITGAARGIGLEIAKRFASEGAKLAICDISEEALQEASQLLHSEYSAEVFTSVCDVSNGQQVTDYVKAVIKEYGQIDALVNNAGITRDTLLMRMTEDDWDLVMKVNLKSVFLFSKAAIRYMMKKRSGAIINMASVIGLIGNPGQGNYAASKAGIIGFTKSMAREVGSRNVRVNAIAPGFIQTKMTDVLTDEIKQKMLDSVPLKTFGQPQDVAALAAFLASDDARYITGQVVNVDGGMVTQ